MKVSAETILDALPPVALIDSSGKIVTVNEAWRNHGAGAVGDSYLQRCSPQAQAGTLQVLQGRCSHFSLEEGSSRLTVTPTPSGDGAVVMVQNNPAERWSRLYAMASAINEAILRTSEPLVLFESACRIAVDGGMLMAWVGFVPEGESDFEVVARWGGGSDYLDEIRLSVLQNSLGNGPSGRAFRSGGGSVCNDIAGDQDFAPWRESALRRGYRSSAAFALKAEGKSVGLFCVYGDQPGLFDQEVMRLLNALADNLSFAMAVHASEKQKSALAQQVERERVRLLEAQSVAKVGSWETDLQSLEVAWTAQTHAIFETDPLHFQVTHSNFLARVHPEDRARVAQAFEASLGEEKPCVLEHRIVTEDGRVKVVEERWQVFHNPERAVGTCLDISQRAQAQAEARKASEALAELVQIQQELTLNHWTVRSAMEFLCRRAQSLTGAAGATVELVEGDHLTYDICSGLAAPHTGMRLGMESSLSGLSVQSSTPLYAADTEVDERVDREACRKVGVRSMVCAPLRMGTQAIGVLKVISDRPNAFLPRDLHHLRILSETLGSILERHQAAEALRRSVEDFRTLAESMPQIVWTTDPEGRCTYLNRLWVEYTGLSLEEKYGNSWNNCIHPEDLAAANHAWEKATRRGGRYSVEFRLRRADGSYRWWLNRGEPLRNEQGEVVRWLGTSTDIHDLTVANRALKMLRQCDESLIRAESEPQLLQSVCDIAVQLGGYHMAWVGYAQEEEGKAIVPQAWSGHEDGYLKELEISWDADKPSGQGPGGRVIREGRAIHIADLTRDARFSPWVEAARKRGYQSVVNLPLRDEERTFGSFSLFRSEVASLSEDELRLLQDLADDLAFGIVTLRARAERQRLQDGVLAIARGVSASLGADFFLELTRHLVDALQGDAGFIALFNTLDASTAHTLAAVVNGLPVPNFQYDLKGTPCEAAVHELVSVCERGARELYPQARQMTELGMDAYACSCLVNARGERVGLIVVLFTKPIRRSDMLVSTLQIFAARAASELQRQQSDARVREQASFLDMAQDAILMFDLDQRISYWNKGAERLYGWSAAEACGRCLTDLLQTDPMASTAARQAVLEGGEWQGELQHRSRQGERLTLSCRWTLVLDGKEAPLSILSIATDITERKLLEEQFLRAQRLESIGRLAGGIAHDLNNALSPILMSVELLRLQFPDPESQELVESISSCAERGAEMVRQLLSFARGVDGERVAVPIAGLLRDVAKIANDTFLKSIQVSASSDPDLWAVMGDRTQIHQVLMNLSVNARDAMPRGGKLILNAQNRVLDSGPYVLLQVIDDGDGIAADVLEKIFDPFFTTKEIGQGTGLGLSTSMAIVKSHEGFVQVHSELGKGTTFEIYLPAQTELPEGSLSDPTAVLARGQNELILVVDDEEPVRKITRRTLEFYGYRVLVAADGLEALKLYALHRQDIRLVLTDMMMPHMDGPTLIKALRSLDPNLPVIGASGLPGQSSVDLKVVLPKPYKTAILLKTLRELLASGPEGR